MNVSGEQHFLYHDFPDGDHRSSPDRDQWLANLRASGAAYLVTGHYDLPEFPIEDRWASGDSERFEPIVLDSGCRLYRVRIWPSDSAR
ncbi:MAG: hypothetical protein HY815_26405 [Candidatus Riflebacteria bacterium]|nr:hypothetical protein [Candidatus Riflebacteria bacterium]